MIVIVFVAVFLLGASALVPAAIFPLEMLANLRPQLAVLCLLVAICFGGVGRWPTATPLVLLAVVLLTQAPDLFRRQGAELQGPALRVIWANIHKESGVARRLARLSAERGADVVIVGEPTRDLAALRAILSNYPYSFGDEAGRHGVLIFSRTPLSETALEGAFLRGDYPIASATVAAPGGALRVIGLHAAVSGSGSRLKARDAQILAAARLAERSGPALVVGDLNATPWATALREVRRLTRVQRLSTGAASTWFAPFPVLGLPIDHALVSDNVEASVTVGPGIGSDHLPLVISIRPARLPG